MVERNQENSYDGLSALAHAVRRSMALHVAMNMTAPEEGMNGLFDKADQCAAWINGKAGQQEVEQQEEQANQPAQQPLGQPWSEVTGGS